MGEFRTRHQVQEREERQLPRHVRHGVNRDRERFMMLRNPLPEWLLTGERGNGRGCGGRGENVLILRVFSLQ